MFALRNPSLIHYLYLYINVLINSELFLKLKKFTEKNCAKTKTKSPEKRLNVIMHNLEEFD